MRTLLFLLLVTLSSCYAYDSNYLNDTFFYGNNNKPTLGDGPPMNLVLFNNGVNCLDGSSAGYYFRPASDSTNDGKFIIHLQGGGYCNDSTSCTQRAQTYLGSSKTWVSSRNQELPYNMLDTDPSVNPDFYSWNHVWVPYCSGDLWAGTRLNATSDSWNLVFAGYSIVVNVLDFLDARMSLNNASDIILTGDSAGGIGTFWNIDYVYNRYNTARVVGVPQAGWFTAGSNYSAWEASGQQNIPYNPVVTEANRYYWGTVVQAYYPPGCKYVNSDSIYCHNMPYLYPYITAPLFVAENAMDEYQVYVLGHCPVIGGDSRQYIEYVGTMMRKTLQAVVNSKKQDGLWAPACLAHEVTFSGPLAPKIQAQSFASTLGAYYFQRQSQGLKSVLMDDSLDPVCYI